MPVLEPAWKVRIQKYAPGHTLETNPWLVHAAVLDYEGLFCAEGHSAASWLHPLHASSNQPAHIWGDQSDLMSNVPGVGLRHKSQREPLRCYQTL